MLSKTFLILSLLLFPSHAVLTLTRSSLHRHFVPLTRSYPIFTNPLSRGRVSLSCNANVCYSEGCARGRNQARRHEARFSVLLRYTPNLQKSDSRGSNLSLFRVPLRRGNQ